jgi:hypothetical protein
MNDIATHAEPAWRSRANFIIQANLDAFGMKGRWEQLWVRRLAEGNDLYELCCIPFFTYGMAMGDVVQTEVGRSFEHEFKEVKKKCGHRSLRVAVVRREEVDELHLVLHEALSRSDFLHEWASPGFVAVDIEVAEKQQAVEDIFQKYADAGRVSLEIDA